MNENKNEEAIISDLADTEAEMKDNENDEEETGRCFFDVDDADEIFKDLTDLQKGINLLKDIYPALNEKMIDVVKQTEKGGTPDLVEFEENFTDGNKLIRLITQELENIISHFADATEFIPDLKMEMVGLDDNKATLVSNIGKCTVSTEDINEGSNIEIEKFTNRQLIYTITSLVSLIATISAQNSMPEYNLYTRILLHSISRSGSGQSKNSKDAEKPKEKTKKVQKMEKRKERGNK